MKVEKYFCGDHELGIQIKLADSRGRVVERGEVRLQIPGGGISLKLDHEKRLTIMADNGTLIVEPNCANVISVRIRDHFT